MRNPTDSCLPTPEMVRHLNLDVIVTSVGNCISAKSRNKTILDDLIAKGYIEPYHADYGLIFTTLREVWLGKLAAKTAMLSDEIFSQCPHIAAPELYDHIYSIMKPTNANIVFWAVITPSSPLPAMVGDACRRAFEILAAAFTDTHKVLANERESR